MATGFDERELNEFLRINGLLECMENLQKFASKKPSEETRVYLLKQALIEMKNDPVKILTAITMVADLVMCFVPFCFPICIILGVIKALLEIYKFLSKKSSKIKVIEQHEYIDADMQRNAFAIQGALNSAFRYLGAIQNRKLNDHEIEIVQSQITRDTGREFLGVLEYKIRNLQKGESEKKIRETTEEKTDQNAGMKVENADKKTGEKAENKEEETEKDTLHRCNAIIALIYLHCVLSCLREFVMCYIATIFTNNNVPRKISESYLERRELSKKNKEALLKVLYNPEEKDASVAAVFNSSSWPKLRQQLRLHTDIEHLINRPLRIIPASTDKFAMFRYDPDIFKLFTWRTYVRVKENSKTKFVLARPKDEGDTCITIHLCEHDDCTWKMSGNLLEASKPTQAEQCDKFNIVRLSNGNVMFSSKMRPTCFIKMEKAENDVRLGIANNGCDVNCQWKLIV